MEMHQIRCLLASLAIALGATAACAETLEGEWPERRRVVIEFPSVEAAKQWWDSSEYAKPKALRRAHSEGRLLLLEGVA